MDNIEKITAVTFDNQNYKRVVSVVTKETPEPEELFGYFADEISFSESELIGLTKAEAHKLFLRKDKEYLQS